MTHSASDGSFTNDVAAFYESMLVPLIFEPYADDLAERVEALTPGSVLEIACGTGVVTRALVARLPESCSITATDLNQAMLGHAEAIGTSRPITWGQADVMDLPYPDNSFDVVVCQFGTMFFPERADAYSEVRRVLKPGGTFLFNIWNGIADNEFAQVVTQALAARFPDDPPQFMVRTPHGHSSPEEIEADVSASGYASCTLTQRDDVSPAGDARLAAMAFCQGTPLRAEIEARDPGGLQSATDAVEAALQARHGQGPIEGKISAVIVSAETALPA